ncbi:globin [Dictyocaulus viviparus]|uniref:Globin n=1 Tax=Dictyocaulus viviparus TaxID=29172 RepID=A0A0D8XXQ9_DICVI|nr:globin [Dictyocaulus viviparus]
MFTNHADLRRYFKGAENYTAEDVQKSERFDKQGQRILLAVYILADTFDDVSFFFCLLYTEIKNKKIAIYQEPTFRAYARETINRHRIYKMDPSLWGAFFTVFVNFLDSRGAVTDEQKAAWKQLGNMFDEECQSHLKALNLPHV